MEEYRRRLPAIHALLSSPPLGEEIARRGRVVVLVAAREELEATRAALLSGEAVSVSTAEILQRIQRRLATGRPSIRPVINATGILLHTGLGRAPLAAEAIQAVAAATRGYCALELDLPTGERGRRSEAVAGLLTQLTGAEAAAVVNNNAAATILALRVLAAGREVIVSRGQLVEIGGSFRLPEIFATSGAILREVGTTNRTRIVDYEQAVGTATAALLRVHPSNYRVVGFTSAVPIKALAKLGRGRGIWTIDDIGSGCLTAERPLPAGSDEPTAAGSIAAGADLVLCSGDKLLGGPQCGILLGRRILIDRITADPLLRALRVDKMTLAALEATLRLALDPDVGRREIPLWNALSTPVEQLQDRAETLAAGLRQDPGIAAEVRATEAQLGGGSAPGAGFPSAAVSIGPDLPAAITPATLARTLRTGDPAVVPRVQAGCVLLDLRTVHPQDDPSLLRAVRGAVRDLQAADS